ncbi:MAG: HAD family phosphatase [Treponema sp.]|jgi:putative hydrolase of the HAD superfamily|nr:HAD family phosphatase [Treponema sp.]
MSIKAVVFDYGGVICFPPDATAERRLAELTGLSVETLNGLNRKYRGEYDRGTFDGGAYYKYILSQAGLFPDEGRLEEIARADNEGWKRINGETLALMRDIKAAGFRVGILSNMPRDFLAWARKNIPVFTGLDAAVFSCEYNLIKPEAAIYEKLREKTGFDYGEIVFFDDLPDNVQKAGELGIKSFVWKGPAAAREELKKIGGAFEVL